MVLPVHSRGRTVSRARRPRRVRRCGAGPRGHVSTEQTAARPPAHDDQRGPLGGVDHEPRGAARTNTTGRFACAATDRPTEPRTKPLTPPRAREPSTRSSASLAASQSASTGRPVRYSMFTWMREWRSRRLSPTSRSMCSAWSRLASTPRSGACTTGCQAWTTLSGSPSSPASRAAPSAAARLSGEPSTPTVTLRGMLSASCCTCPVRPAEGSRPVAGPPSVLRVRVRMEHGSPLLRGGALGEVTGFDTQLHCVEHLDGTQDDGHDARHQGEHTE